MYERLIPAVIETFSAPGEPEEAFLRRVRQADLRLKQLYRTKRVVSAEPYADPLIRAAYLLRYLGHYTLQLGDLLRDLQGTAAEPVLARSHLRLVTLCGGSCPEAIALAALHQQAAGERLEVTVLDRNSDHWADCWPIIRAIAEDYPQHPDLTIKGLAIDLIGSGINASERSALQQADIFTAMNCLNELVGLSADGLRRGLSDRLDALPRGALVLASDQAGYSSCERGLRLLQELLIQRGGLIMLEELDRLRPHEARNSYQIPERIRWMYDDGGEYNFRTNVRQLRLAALMP